MKKSYMAAEDSDTGIKIYLREIGQIPLLTPDQEIELAAKIKKGDREARALMIRSNLRLVVKIAHDYANLGLPLLDLISEGNIGLMKAVERFDPAKGGKLSTYAAWWIKQSIKRALANQSKTIRLPVHLVDKISKMRRVSLQMSEELGREPTDEELGDEIGIARGKNSSSRGSASVSYTILRFRNFAVPMPKKSARWMSNSRSKLRLNGQFRFEAREPKNSRDCVFRIAR